MESLARMFDVIVPGQRLIWGRRSSEDLLITYRSTQVATSVYIDVVDTK